MSFVRPVRLPSTQERVSADSSRLAAKWKRFRAVSLLRPSGVVEKPLLLSFRQVRCDRPDKAFVCSLPSRLHSTRQSIRHNAHSLYVFHVRVVTELCS